jgi:hypothetical protein
VSFRDFLLKYTTALYHAPQGSVPRYDEFRDMFSRGQVLSKEWLVKEALSLLSLDKTQVCIVGSWFGTLAYHLHDAFPSAKINCLDIDPRCEIFLNHLAFAGADLEWLKAITGDMHHYSYREDVVINTSCEHLQDVRGWLRRIPSGTKVVLQSNNYPHNQHLSTSKNLNEFYALVSPLFSHCFFQGELELDIYKRFMLIGEMR